MELAPLKARTGRCENIGEDGEKIAGSLLARGKEILYLARIWIYINTKWRRRPELFHRRFILRPLEVPEEVKEDCYLQAVVLKVIILLPGEVATISLNLHIVRITILGSSRSISSSVLEIHIPDLSSKLV
ncbi:hypothetical protein VPH35_020901 [Triticum aestivum]